MKRNERNPFLPLLSVLVAVSFPVGVRCDGSATNAVAFQPAAEIHTQSVTVAPVNLFTSRTQSALAADLKKPLPGGFPPALRSRSIDLNPSVVSGAGTQVGLALVLDLFPDAAFTARVDRVSLDANGTVTTRGRIQGYPMGTVILTTAGERSLAVIEIPELRKMFSIQNEVGREEYDLIDVDLDRVVDLEGGPPRVASTPVVSTLPVAAGNPWADPLEPVTVDIMIAYTPAARAWADADGGGILNVIAQAVAKCQLAQDNSGTFLTINLVHSEEIAYTETGTNSRTDFDRLHATGDGYMDAVHEWRDLYGADVVSLFVFCSDVGGLGCLLNTAAGSPADGFCLNRVQQAGWTFSLVHEMSHNMGCHHDKAQNVEPGPGVFPYSAGWHWTGSDNGKYCSVMTYEDGKYFSDGVKRTRVAYFSNPAVQHLGAATGDAVDGDNARTLREIKGVIASYRQAATVQFKSATYTAAENGGSVRIYVSRTGGASGAASVNYATSNGTATAGSDYTTKTGTLSWTAGSAADKHFDVAVLNDGAAEGDETFTVVLSGASGVGLGTPGTTTVQIADDDYAEFETNAVARHWAAGYRSPGTNTIVCEFVYPSDQTLASLIWSPGLPLGWTLDSACGDGNPSVVGTNIVFGDPLTNRPVAFRYFVTVPGDQALSNTLSGSVGFRFASMAGEVLTVSVTPDPLTLHRYHGGDCVTNDWAIDGAEASRVLEYWRSGAYHVEPLACDGFAPGEGNTNGCRHSGDYCPGFWTIDTDEANRFLAYWRAGGYRVDPAGDDGYAAGCVGATNTAAPDDSGEGDDCVIEQSGPSFYDPGGTIVISNTFASGEELLSLCWKPSLPAGWTIGAVSGEGEVESLRGDILWTGALPAGPIRMTYEVHIPLWETGDREIGAEAGAYLAGRVNALQSIPVPAVLRLPPRDTDGDGISDGWEERYSGSPTGLEPHAHGDDDGMDNLQEFIAGTDPLDRESALKLKDIAPDAGAKMLIRWQSVTNRQYAIGKSDGACDAFRPAATNIRATPPTNVYEDATDGQNAGFYRIEVEE